MSPPLQMGPREQTVVGFVLFALAGLMLFSLITRML